MRLVLWVFASIAAIMATAHPLQAQVSCRDYFSAPDSVATLPRQMLTFDQAVEIARFGLSRHVMAGTYRSNDEAVLRSHLERAGRAILAMLDPRGMLLPVAERRHFEALIRDGSLQLFDEVWLFDRTNDGPVARLMAAVRDSIAQARTALRDPRALLARARSLQAADLSTPLDALAFLLRTRTQEQLALGFSEDESVPFAVRRILAELDVRENYALSSARPSMLLIAVFHGLDPHSYYLTPDAAERDRVERRGTYRGIGVRFIDTPVGARVTGISAGSPADRAGIRVGDAIVGLGVARFTVDQFDALARALAADQGGPVLTLRLQRDGRERELTVVRERVVARARVEGDIQRGMDGQDYAVVRILDFTKGVANEVHSAVSALLPRASGVLIDLRGNAGGLVDEATAVAVDFVVTPSQPVLRVMGAPTRTYVSAQDHLPVYAGPLVILVDSASASGAEVVAGVLQTLGRAVIVGHTTEGKGTGQTIFSGEELPGPGTLSLTEGYYFLPDGRSPQRTGIQPEVVLPSRPGPVVAREADLAGALPESRIEPLLGPMPPTLWDRRELEQRLIRRFGSGGPFGARGEVSRDPERTMALGVLEELAGLARR